uniref:Uncharacterized protein n=1 Tax=Rhizophora mucronata TaxID=61149 RepID=A0A2P2QBH0_RHIMU
MLIDACRSQLEAKLRHPDLHCQMVNSQEPSMPECRVSIRTI